nr:ras GTPase-activating-like protein IQGAP2 [Pelodiscus sinensis]|eukprot:XP_025041010.1 ras GTPase-activating-like protein IQGAP2 [Pelodiscus sinensis]
MMEMSLESGLSNEVAKSADGTKLLNFAQTSEDIESSQGPKQVGKIVCTQAIVDDERLSAEEMDERRRQNIAYEYLCHLEEAKRWMEVCLDEELPPTTELEEGLRNGVYLAKLAKFFAPKMVSEKKIYDVEQTRYKKSGLHFRHTDNTVQWLRAMESIGLPKVRI